MKTIKLTFIALLMLTAFTNCKKDKETTTTPTVNIYGIWDGAFNDNNTYSFIISKNNKALDVKNGSGVLIATGNWELTDKNFTANYTFNGNGGFINNQKLYAKATFDSKAGKLNNGSIGTTAANPTGSGEWLTMTKQ